MKLFVFIAVGIFRQSFCCNTAEIPSIFDPEFIQDSTSSNGEIISAMVSCPESSERVEVMCETTTTEGGASPGVTTSAWSTRVDARRSHEFPGCKIILLPCRA